MNKKTLIIDSQVTGYSAKDQFNPEFAKGIHHTLLANCYLARACEAKGIAVITATDYMTDMAAYADSSRYLLSHLWTPRTEGIIKSGAKPLLLTCQESPFIATRFYALLPYYSSKFLYSMVFPGMKKMLSRKTSYLPMHFPETPSAPPIEIPFEQRKKIVAVVANKHASMDWKTWPLRLLYGSGVENISGKRFATINAMMKGYDLDLYGRGWPVSDGKDKGHYMGESRDKTETVSAYRLCLCFENSSFPGYVTEKIFDCFFAGTIPVYLGAPDIAQYVPEDAFIDMRKFADTQSLCAFLDSIDKNAFERYRKNAESFLASEGYRKFDQDAYARQVISLIETN